MATVLIVDDDADIRTLLAKIVEQEGHTAVTAGNTAEAMTVLDKAEPALVFLDVDMPGETGVSLVLRLREHKVHESVPIVFVTAYQERCAALQRANVGAARIIGKPFHRGEIVEMLKTFCSKT